MAKAPERLDVLFLTHNYPRYEGDYAGRFIDRLARLLLNRGVRVGVLTPHAPGAKEYEFIDGTPVWRFRYAPDAEEILAYQGKASAPTLFGPRGLWAHRRFFTEFTRSAKRIALESSPRVVHAHWWIPAGWVARAVAGGRRFIITSHGTDIRILEKKPWMRLLASRPYGKADQVTVVSRWMRDALLRYYPRLEGRISIAPMPPDDDAFHGSVRTEPGKPAVILCVTRYTVQKRTQVLIRALGMMRNRGVDFRCRLVGDCGPEREPITSLIDELGLNDHISLIPSMPQYALADEYRRADVCVLPAVDEGFGLVLVEAQLCGCAVIGARSGGIVDIIEDGVSGRLFNPDDSNALADSLEQVVTNGDLRVRLARAGQQSAQRRFSSSAIVDQFIEWYQLK